MSGAKLVCNFLEDITPEEEKLKLDLSQSAPVGHRKKGTGRPTKKERRIIDGWKDVFFFNLHLFIIRFLFEFNKQVTYLLHQGWEGKI